MSNPTLIKENTSSIDVLRASKPQAMPPEKSMEKRNPVPVVDELVKDSDSSKVSIIDFMRKILHWEKRIPVDQGRDNGLGQGTK